MGSPIKPGELGTVSCLIGFLRSQPGEGGWGEKDGRREWSRQRGEAVMRIHETVVVGFCHLNL